MNTTEWQIVIAERGWVYVGRVSRDGDFVLIRDAHNVRRWGTTGGLGELALKGPLADTILDYYGTVRVHVLATAGGSVECDDAIWNKWAAKKGGRK